MKSSSLISVGPWDPVNKDYDVTIGTVGYEQRARFVFSHLNIAAPTKAAFGFREQKVLAYKTNYDWYSSHGFKVTEPSTDELRTQFGELVRVATADHRRICIDISSMTRLRMAVFVDILRRLDGESIVDFLYSIAEYSAPPRAFFPNTHVGPVLPAFSGWWTNPAKPPVAVVGLGYEEDKGLGAVEHIQAPEIWTFLPHSSIRQYSEALEKANETLLALVPQDHKIRYKVEDPLGCFDLLRTFTYGLIQRANPILLPFGPKIFALCCLLTGALYSQVAVWRVSPQHEDEPADRIATGQVLGLRVVFRT